MTTKAVRATIKLGDIDLNAYHLEDGSYAALDLFRLAHTDIYRYGEYWYWLGSDVPPGIEERRCWDRRRGAFLAFQGNKFSYLYVNLVDYGREISYVPVPSDLKSVIEFCVLGRLASDKAIFLLERALDYCYSCDGSSRAHHSHVLLRDTAAHLRNILTLPASSSTPKKSSSKRSKKSTEVIYLVKLDAHLKLGFTRNIDQRLRSFKNTNVRVELINSVEGTMQMEKRLHSILGSKARELYDFKDEQRIIEAMGAHTSLGNQFTTQH
jgi:hypothetical protein